MKHLLILLISILLLSSPLFGQSQRPETIIVPVSSMGDVSDTRKQILENTLTDELKKHFRIVPQEKYEQVLEQVFEELEYEECTEDQCIMRVQEMLQVENVFNLQVLGEDKDTQLNLTWRTLDEKKNETDVCLGCGTFQLNDKVRGLVEKLVGEKPIVVRVVRKEKGILFRDTPFSKFVEGGKKWIKFGDEETQVKFEGEIVDGVPNGEGTENFPNGQKYFGEFKDGLPNGQGMETFPDGKKYFGEWKDGREWNTKHTKKDGTLLGKYKNGKWIVKLFVSVGEDGIIFTSSDGNSWTERTSGTSEDLYEVTYGNGLFVVVGKNGTILISSDVTTWTERDSGTSKYLRGVTYGNGPFVTVGRGTTITSTDGTYWTERDSGTSEYLRGVTYGNGLFVMVGYSGTILTSPDVTTWTERTSGTSEYLKGVTYGNGLFVTVGGRTILTSTDGNSWTRNIFVKPVDLLGVTYGNGLFVVVGEDGIIFTSSDGNSWTERTSGTSEDLYEVTYGNGLFVVVGEDGIIFTSSDGNSWTERTSGTSEDLFGVTYSQ